MPCTAKRLPSVTISDGTAVRITMIPLTSPTITPKAIVTMMPT